MTPTICRAVFARLILPAALLACLAAVTACATESGPSAAQDLEATAQGIDKNLMCPICPSETIDQSQTEIANQMRRTVREKLTEGESRDDILQFFVDRYGQDVLAVPPKSGFNLLVWLAPPIACCSAAVLWRWCCGPCGRTIAGARKLHCRTYRILSPTSRRLTATFAA